MSGRDDVINLCPHVNVDIIIYEKISYSMMRLSNGSYIIDYDSYQDVQEYALSAGVCLDCNREFTPEEFKQLTGRQIHVVTKTEVE